MLVDAYLQVFAIVAPSWRSHPSASDGTSEGNFATSFLGAKRKISHVFVVDSKSLAQELALNQKTWGAKVELNLLSATLEG